MKKKYTLEEDGFVGYWHPSDKHEGHAIIVFPGSGADYELTRKGSRFLRKAGWSGLLYTTSQRQEGYLILSGEGIGTIGFIDGMKMIFAEKKALGGFKRMKDFVSSCFSGGGTIETRMRKAKRKFIRIEVLAVRPEYQRQGYMRKMMEGVYRLADKKSCRSSLTRMTKTRVCDISTWA